MEKSFINHLFKSPIMNAAGVYDTTYEELDLLAGVEGLSLIVSKSCTLEKRDGNPEPRYYHDRICSVNSTGLANKGYKYYGEVAKRLNSKLELSGKKFIVSIASLDGITGMKQMITYFSGIDEVFALELNLSCPNIVGKSQPAYDFEQLNLYLGILTEDLEKPWGIKLPPYFDNCHFQKVASILSKYKPSFITCVNSIPLTLHIDPDEEKYQIAPNWGRGGLGGACIKSIALANVQTFRQLLGGDIPIIGCGGITRGKDLFEHILAGASMVQIGTQFYKEGPRKAVSRIMKELEDHLEKRGYSTLDEIIPLCCREI